MKIIKNLQKLIVISHIREFLNSRFFMTRYNKSGRSITMLFNQWLKRKRKGKNKCDIIIDRPVEPEIPTDPEDPTNEYLDVYVLTEEGFRTNFTNSIWSHPNIFPNIYVFMNIDPALASSFINGTPRANSPLGFAQLCADYIAFYINGIQAAHSRTITKYNLELRGFDDPYYLDIDLFNHPDDRLTDEQGTITTPWCTNAIDDYQAFMEQFVPLLKTELTNRGLPFPTRLDMDVEDNVGVTNIVRLLADERANTILIDGRYTLFQHFTGAILPNGNGVKELINPGYYDWEFEWWARCIRSLVRDYVLYETCYKYFVEEFPDIRTSNYASWCGTEVHQGYADKDFHSSYYKNEYLYATDQAPINYTTYFIDLIDPTWDVALYGTYNNCLIYYNVNDSNDKNAVVNEMFIKKCGFQVTSNKNANPNKPIAIWHWHQPQEIQFDNTYVPGGAKLIINTNTLINQLKAYYDAGVRTVLAFEADHYANGYIVDGDIWVTALNALNDYIDGLNEQ